MTDNNLIFIDVASSVQVKQELHDSPQEPAKAEKRFHCNMCHYTTYHRSLFQEHLNRHTGIKPYKCELCPYTSVSKKYAKQHQEKHKSCICGYVSKNRREFKRHVNKCSKNVANTTHACPHCKKEYVDEKAVAKHSARAQVCSLCSATCCSLRTHVAQAHAGATHIAKKERFQCALCPWSSSLSQKILLHLIHHPAQLVDEAVVDVTVLRVCGILPHK